MFNRRRLLSLLAPLLILALLVPLLPCPEARGAEYLSFGSYPQSAVEPTAALLAAAYDEEGDAWVEGERYRRVADGSGGFAYFRYEPILWTLWDAEAGLYLARSALDSRPYDRQEEHVLPSNIAYAYNTSWEACSLRAWLNGAFLETAFTAEEQAMLGSAEDGCRVTLLPWSAMAGVSFDELRRKPTDYASALGCETPQRESFGDNCVWLLRDVSPWISSCVCYVSYDGVCSNGNRFRVSQTGLGVVPCIVLRQSRGLDTVQLEEQGTFLMYSPGGETREVTAGEEAQRLAEGWYRSQQEADAALAEEMNRRFRALSVYPRYAGDVVAWAGDGENSITLNYPGKNPGDLELANYIKPLVDAAFTGKQADYLCLYIQCEYDSPTPRSWEDFKALADERTDALQVLWHELSELVHITGNYSSLGRIRFRLGINGAGTSGVYITEYYSRLQQLAAEARAYSSRPVGQLQYFRHYLAENVEYQYMDISSNPVQVLLMGQGVCGDYAAAVYDFCRVLGIPCLILTSEKLSHYWNAVYLEGAWYELDTTGISTARFTKGNTYQAYDPAGLPENLSAAELAGKDGFLFEDVWYSDVSLKGQDLLSPEVFAALEALAAGAPTPGPFTDVLPDSYYAPAVGWALNKGVTTGTGPSTFSPAATVTRGQAVTFLWRAMGKPSADSGETAFRDVPEDAYYAEAVRWAVERGITTGVSETAFAPDKTCSYGEILTFLLRTLAPEQAAPAPGEAWYAPALRWAREAGIGPGDNVSQAEACPRADIVYYLYLVLAG